MVGQDLVKLLHGGFHDLIHGQGHLEILQPFLVPAVRPLLFGFVRDGVFLELSGLLPWLQWVGVVVSDMISAGWTVLEIGVVRRRGIVGLRRFGSIFIVVKSTIEIVFPGPFPKVGGAITKVTAPTGSTLHTIIRGHGSLAKVILKTDLQCYSSHIPQENYINTAQVCVFSGNSYGGW